LFIQKETIKNFRNIKWWEYKMRNQGNVSLVLTEKKIRNKIYTIRGLQVMLDRDLAELYRVETKVFNQAIKRNLDLFPKDFMFKLSKKEFENLRSQFVTSSWGGRRYYPLVFTEQGIAMLSGVLKSSIARQINIQIMRAFVEMRRFLMNNAQVFQRLDNVERKQIEYKIDTDKKIEKIFEALEENEIKPKQGIFYDGQVFDAYKFVSDIIRKAKKSIILIDNYIDDTVLSLFIKRNKNVEVIILTKNISRQLKLDIEKYNEQYPRIELREFNKSHDRFIIIDGNEIYHFGASLKDLGKKWFAFSKMDKKSLGIIEKISCECRDVIYCVSTNE
jgi:hypothetical protein